MVREKQHQIKQHRYKKASTTQRTDEHKQRTTESTDIENISERKHKLKKKRMILEWDAYLKFFLIKAFSKVRPITKIPL